MTFERRNNVKKINNKFKYFVMTEKQNSNFEEKRLLYILFYDLTSEIRAKKIEIEKDDFEENINLITFPQLIQYVQESIKILVRQKVDEAKKDNILSHQKYFTNPNQNDFYIYESQLKKLEEKERHLSKLYFQNKIQKESLEYKIGEYMQMEEEFEEMKTKYKYEEGKFLENERKDSEIYILRAENTNLKKEIESLSKKNLDFTKKFKHFEKEIEKHKQLNQSLQKKLEEKQKELNLISNINININSTTPLRNERNDKNELCINCSKKRNKNNDSNNNTNNNYTTSIINDQTQLDNIEKINLFHQIKPKASKNKIRFNSNIPKKRTRNDSLDKSKSDFMSRFFNGNLNQSNLNINYNHNSNKIKLCGSNSVTNITNISQCPIISQNKKPSNPNKINLNDIEYRNPLKKIHRKRDNSSYKSILNDVLN